MKKINILFTAVLCATITLFVSCGDSKKTKYTFAPVWDSSITEKDTTGIVGHTFKGMVVNNHKWVYFSENGFEISLIIRAPNSTTPATFNEELVKEDLQLIYNMDADLKKQNAKRTVSDEQVRNFKNRIESQTKYDWYVDEYFVNVKDCVTTGVSYGGSDYKIEYKIRKENGKTVIEYENLENNISYSLYE